MCGKTALNSSSSVFVRSASQPSFGTTFSYADDSTSPNVVNGTPFMIFLDSRARCPAICVRRG